MASCLAGIYAQSSMPCRQCGATDQINLTDEDKRVMPVAGGGFEQCYNAQAAVAAGIWDGRHYDILVPVARALEDSHPVAATVLYRALLNDILSRAKSVA